METPPNHNDEDLEEDNVYEVSESYTLEEAFTNVDHEVRIIKQPNAKNYGPYNFLVQMPQCVLFYGKVYYNMVLKIKDLDRKPLIKIKPYLAFLPNGQQFSVNHGDKPLGILTLNPLTNTLLITSNDGTYTAQEMENDFLISKLDSTTTLATIHIPTPSAEDNVQPFECFVTFQAEINPVEKSLFISLALAHMMVRNGPILAKESRRPVCRWNCCFSVCVGLVFALIMIIIMMKSMKRVRSHL